MSELERKRTLSESSGDEAELCKVARLDGSDQDSLTEVTERSDSDSSSDSGSDSDSNSSSTSGSSGEETQTQPKISPNLNSLPALRDQTQTDESYQEHSHQYSEEGKLTNVTHGIGSEIEEDLEKNLLAKKFDSDLLRRRQGSGLSLENPDEGDFSLGSIDILKQFLTVSAEDASCGPVDPVFVNHEDSQHATHMDSLVFETVGEGLEGEDDMNEPRLDSVCNSNIHSAEGSLVLGNDMEDGELPSSPEITNKVEEAFTASTGDPAFTVTKLEETEVKISNHAKSEEESDFDPDQVRRKKRLKKKMKKTKYSEIEKEDGELGGAAHSKRQKHKKFKSGSPRLEDNPKHSEPSIPLVPLAIPAPPAAPAPVSVPTLPAVPAPSVAQTPTTASVTTAAAPTTMQVPHVTPAPSPVQLPAVAPTPIAVSIPADVSPATTTVPVSTEAPAITPAPIKATAITPALVPATAITSAPIKATAPVPATAIISAPIPPTVITPAPIPVPAPAPSPISVPAITPALAKAPAITPAPVPAPCRPSAPIPSSTPAPTTPPLVSVAATYSSAPDNPTVAQTAPVSEPAVVQAAPVSCPVTKGRRISLKDYKAKKEAEKQRRSQEGSGSESNSCPTSQNTSKETSPSPEPSKVKDSSASEAALSTTENGIESKTGAPVEDIDTTEEPQEMEPISDTEMDLANIDDMGNNEVLALRDFDVLDELEESDNDTSKESGDDSCDSLAEDEVDQMLEEKVPNAQGDAMEDIEPQEKLKKLVLEERGGNLFEVLPLGWVAVTHNSGIPLYLHRDTRVVTASRPYDLGNGSVRKHNLPISAIPCFSYRYSSSIPPPASSTDCSTSTLPPTDSSNVTSAVQPSCPYASTSSSIFSRENVSPDSTTDGALPPPSVPNSAETTNAPSDAAGEISNIFPRAQIETIEETMKKSELTPEEITNYCRKIFVFKELEVAKFKTWKERRAYYKQSQKKKIEKELSNRPTLPEGTKIITIPALEMSTIPGTEGDSAINQKVVKKSKKKWLINPVGKSMVCLLHEYVQQSLKMQPYYTFTELDNAATPYAAIVHINKIEYGRGTGSSKKIAKSEAARRTLEMLIPEIKDKLPSMTGGDEVGDGPDLSFFDDIRVEDPRVADLCNRTSEPAPYQILVTCLQRNYGLGDTHIHQELKAVRNGKNEYTMRVDKREVAVICKNKKDGKQLAAAKLLQQLHPHISSWGSLLRMYGNRSIRTLKKKKDKETEVTGLQSRSSQSAVAPSMAILEKLKEEMRNLREIKKSIAPIGKFVLPSGSSQTGINTDHVDF